MFFYTGTHPKFSHMCRKWNHTFLWQKQLSTVKWQLLPIKNAFSFCGNQWITWGKTTKCFISSTMDFNAALPWKELEEGRDQETPPPGVSVSQPKYTVQGLSGFSKDFYFNNVFWVFLFPSSSSSKSIISSPLIPKFHPMLFLALPAPTRLTPIPAALHMWLPSTSASHYQPGKPRAMQAVRMAGAPWCALVVPTRSELNTSWDVSCPAGHLTTLSS